MAFKGVFLEGLEVVIIVLTLGTTDHNVGLPRWRPWPPPCSSSAVGIVVAGTCRRCPRKRHEDGWSG